MNLLQIGESRKKKYRKERKKNHRILLFDMARMEYDTKKHEQKGKESKKNARGDRVHRLDQSLVSCIKKNKMFFRQKLIIFSD